MEQPVDTNALLSRVSADWNVAPEDVLSRSRRKDLVSARNAIAVVLWHQGWSQVSIGQFLGRRGHSVVSRALARVRHEEPSPENKPKISPSPRERPTTVAGATHRLRTGHGNMYVTVDLDEAGKPFEIFAVLGKAGGCNSAQLEAISRLASLALRAGVDPEEIVAQLRGITCCPTWDQGIQVRSPPDAMALALAKHVRAPEIVRS